MTDIAFLISCGHREGDIGEYAIDKFHAYVAAARKLEARRRQTTVSDTYAAVAGLLSKKGSLQEYIDSLTIK